MALTARQTQLKRESVNHKSETDFKNETDTKRKHRREGKRHKWQRRKDERIFNQHPGSRGERKWGRMKMVNSLQNDIWQYVKSLISVYHVIQPLNCLLDMKAHVYTKTWTHMFMAALLLTAPNKKQGEYSPTGGGANSWGHLHKVEHSEKERTIDTGNNNPDESSHSYAKWKRQNWVHILYDFICMKFQTIQPMYRDRNQLSGSLGMRERGENYLPFVGHLACARNCSACNIRYLG